MSINEKDELDAHYVRDTEAHIAFVGRILNVSTVELTERALVHDQSKFSEAERSVFAAGTPSRDAVPYGTPAYAEHMKTVMPALKHHYKHNRHHPEHHENGIHDMNLIDLLEMLADWMAASMKHDDGDPRRIHRAIAVNQERFGYSDEMARMLHRTARHLLAEKARQELRDTQQTHQTDD